MRRLVECEELILKSLPWAAALTRSRTIAGKSLHEPQAQIASCVLSSAPTLCACVSRIRSRVLQLLQFYFFFFKMRPILRHRRLLAGNLIFRPAARADGQIISGSFPLLRVLFLLFGFFRDARAS